MHPVDRGTFSWGSTSRNASSTNKSGPPNVTPSPPLGTGAWGGAAKIQPISVSVNESGNLVENTQPSSPSSAARPSSAPTSTRAWGMGAKVNYSCVVFKIPLSYLLLVYLL